MKILELFPTPVAIINLPIELSSVVNWFYNQEMLLGTGIDVDNYGDRSKNSYILNEQPCTNLRNFILKNVKIFGDQLGYDYSTYKITQSWLSYKHPNQHHTTHTHPNSLISGVLYFGESEEKTPAIRFHNPIFGTNVSYISPKKINDKRNLKYAWEYFSIDFEPGLLIIFPSYFHHSVPVNKTNKVRCSLAFNSMPEKSLGDENNLTEFIF